MPKNIIRSDSKKVKFEYDKERFIKDTVYNKSILYAMCLIDQSFFSSNKSILYAISLIDQSFYR